MAAFGLLQTHFNPDPLVVGLPAIAGTDSGGAAVIGSQVELRFGSALASGVIAWLLDGSPISGQTAATLTVPVADGSQLGASLDGQSAVAVDIRYPLPSLATALVDQSFETASGVQTYDAGPGFSFAGTAAYTIVDGAAGVSIAASSGVVSFDTAATQPTVGTPIRIRLSDAGDASRFVEASFDLTITQAADTTAPILSAATATASGASDYTGTVTTDEAGGTLFVLVSENSTETAATVTTSGTSQGVSQAGVQNLAGSGLMPLTSYRLHLLHRDAAGNASAVLSSDPFTTAGTGSWTITDNGDGTFDIPSAPTLRGPLTVTDNGDGTFDIAA